MSVAVDLDAADRHRGASVVVWVTLAALVVFIVWAYSFELDEVASGTGKVVPTSRDQVIQSLEGGILSSLQVREGDTVEPGQVLAQLDRTRVQSSVQESASRRLAAQATAARLRAEVSGAALDFPPEVRRDPVLVAAETALYEARMDNLSKSLSGLTDSIELVQRELKLTESLNAMGAASDVEVLRLRRQAADLQTRASDLRTQFLVRSREELARANAEADVQRQVEIGRADTLSRLTLVSPVRGVVKDVEVKTVGGVIPPNGRLMVIVPSEDQLLVEARFSPRDVAFLRPGQRATVKLSAYDYTVYGALRGEVKSISPDTLQDEVRRDEYYYRVLISTQTDARNVRTGEKLAISPGMVATVDVHTGSKSVWTYLMKPLNRASEALRER
jgi:membrane fusion protein, adhesin transport system